LLEEIRVALERTRSSFLSSGLLAVLVVLSGFYLQEASAAEQAKRDPAIEKRIQELIPSLEGYIATGMKGFDVPGLAIGIVAGDKLIYAKGFGGRRKGGGELVDARTVFQIGSTTKAFLAASMAITVDHGKVHWDDRVIDLGTSPMALVNGTERTLDLPQAEALAGAHAHSRFFYNHRTTRLPAATLQRVHCRVPTIATSAPGRGALPSRSKRPRAGGTDQAGANHRSGLLGSSQRRRNRI
jgi:Beta-lactamase